MGLCMNDSVSMTPQTDLTLQCQVSKKEDKSPVWKKLLCDLCIGKIVFCLGKKVRAKRLVFATRHILRPMAELGYVWA